MSYKVLIPTAGTGSRLGGMTKYINKSLIDVGNTPTISRIIDHFPADTEFVIAVGYKGQLVKEYLSLAHPNLKVQFVDILLYEGEGSGLGLSILKCKDFLQEPFVFCACDTLVTEDIPTPDSNWMGYDHREALNRYRKILLDNQGMIVSVDEKDAQYGQMSEAYIGLAGIHDWQIFWDAMEEGADDAIEQGEAYGFRKMLPKGVRGEKFTWYDIGVIVELEATRKKFQNPDTPNILGKPNEAIWFYNDRVIKFADDPEFISDRVKRAKMLQGFTPQIIGNTTHMYCYDYVQGDVLSACISRPLFKKLLNFSEGFWQQRDLDDAHIRDFKNACMHFYKDKTYQRIKLFYEKFKKQDNADWINEVEYPTLESILNEVDWDYIADGLPRQIHGDYHFENIVYNSASGEFKFLDWRQNFEKSLDIGDIYYDFAKLNHGMIVCHELIAKNLFEVKWEEDKINFDFARKQRLVECESMFYGWLKEKGYDVHKVKLMTALIFLNIAALHDWPYVLLLYGLGKQMLYDVLREREFEHDKQI